MLVGIFLLVVTCIALIILGAVRIAQKSSARSRGGQAAPLQSPWPSAQARVPYVAPLPTALDLADNRSNGQWQAPRRSPATWVPAGRSLVVGDYLIPGGLLFVGESLPSTGRANVPDPGLIDPRLQVDTAHPNRAGTGMPYWPSYSSITPQQRAAYLEWLAGGRGPGAPLGYVFLFFYGLERRLLASGPERVTDGDERNAILGEIERLLRFYEHSASFRGYATRLVDFVRGSQGAAREASTLVPPPDASGLFPLGLRTALGALAKAGRPVPAAWAFAWVQADAEIALPTPLRRCPDEYRTLFAIRYAERFGDGIVVAPGKRIIAASYTPASEGFRGNLSLGGELPDVATLRRPRRKLADLAAACAGELAPYSRYLGKHPEGRRTLAAEALLPSAMVATSEQAAGSPTSEAATVLDRAQRALEGHGSALVETGQLFSKKPDRAQATTLAAFLERHRIWFEPDVRFGAPLPKEEGKLVIFRPEGTMRVALPPRAEYRAAALLLHLAVLVAAADGAIEASERTHLWMHVASMTSLTEAERERLRAHVQWLMEEQPNVQTLKKRLATLSREQRGAVAHLLVGVACADGRIDTAEVKVLTKLFAALGLDESEVHRRLHAAVASLATPSDEPVSVIEATGTSGFEIPEVSGEPDTRSAVKLDATKVARLEEETRQVAALLESVFASDAPEYADANVDAAIADDPSDAETGSDARVTPAAVGRLNEAHASFARALAAHAEWKRIDVVNLAKSFDLLPDAALERLNDAALDAGHDEFAYGDDLLAINQPILEELCA